MEKATIYAKNGYPVKLRKNPSGGNTLVLTKIPVGTTVLAKHFNEAWIYVEWKNFKGYVMVQFVLFDSAKLNGIMGYGKNSFVTANDIRNHGKVWTKDIYTTHPQIKIMQKHVNDWVTKHFNDLGVLNADGIYGNRTIAFVERFQQYRTKPTLKADGIVGKSTLWHIEKMYGTIN